jgi:hypothetical protein
MPKKKPTSKVSSTPPVSKTEHESSQIVTGRLVLRHRGDALDGSGRNLFMVVGVIAVPKDHIPIYEHPQRGSRDLISDVGSESLFPLSIGIPQPTPEEKATELHDADGVLTSCNLWKI